MRIPCPYCGLRDVAEFTYQGDATVTRPDPASDDQAAWNAYVYDRANPAGKHREYWQHSGGCRALLVVERDTVTHTVGKVTYARDRASESSASPAPKPARRTTAKKAAPRRPAGKAAK